MATQNRQQRELPKSALDTDKLSQELVRGAPLEDYLPYQLFRIVNRLTLNLGNDLRPAKMTLARWRTLSVLTASNGLRMGELARYMVIEQAALSRIVDQMERDNLVIRRVASDDNRVVRVYLEAAGRRMFENIRPLELHHYEQAIEGIAVSDLQILSSLLHRLWENIDR